MRYILFILFLFFELIVSAQVDKTYNYEFALIEANRQKSIGNLHEAINLYKKCLIVKPESSIAAYELGTIYIAINEAENAYKYFTLAYQGDPDNYWFFVSYIETLKATEEYKEARSILRKYLKNKEDAKLRYSLAVVYEKQGKNKKALKNLDLIELKGGVSEIVILKKVEIFKKLSQYDKGEIELKKLINLVPESPDFYIVMAEYLEEIGDNIRATDYYHKAYIRDSSNLYAVTNLAEYYINNHDFKKGFSFLKMVFEMPRIKLENKAKSLLFYLEDLEFINEYYTDLEDLINVLIRVYPEEGIVKRLAYDFYYKNEKYDKAYLLIRELIDMEKDSYILWQQVIFNASLLNKYDDIIELGNTAINYFPNKIDLYLYIGIAHYQKSEYSKAYEILKANYQLGLEEGLQIQYLTFLAESSYKMDYLDESIVYFEELILLNPNNNLVLNNYSYYLSLAGKKLDRAKKLSSKTIESEPENPVYLDTYGWILYVMNENEEALIYLKKAVSFSDDPDVLFHYAEALLKEQNIAMAKEFYEKAAKKGYDSEIIKKKLLLCH